MNESTNDIKGVFLDMRRLICLLLILITVAFHANAQDNSYAKQFNSLMDEPDTLVNALVNFPWKKESPQSLPGFKSVTPDSTLRIVSIQLPMPKYSHWQHWESSDGNVWVDLVSFVRPGDAPALDSAIQIHSGYKGAKQLLMFSQTGDKSREAVGAAVIAANGFLLNAGVKLPLEIHWDRPLPESDRVALDAAIARLKETLELLARTVLDPNYVTFNPGLQPRPEALRMLRMAGFARLWSYIKYNFVFLDQRSDVNWDAVLEEYMPRIAAAKDDVAYGLLLRQAVALLKDGHTLVVPNSPGPLDAPPIWLEPVEGRPVAAAVGSLAELSEVRPGMELLEIDDTPVDTIIKRDLDPYISSGTIQDRQLRRMWWLLKGPTGSKMRTKWQSLDGNVVNVLLTRNWSKDRSVLKLPSPPRFEHRKLPGNIAYIALNSFAHPDIVKSFESEFNSLRAAKAWIIDLRENGGGSTGYAYQILSHFIPAATPGSTSRIRLYNAYLEAVGGEQTWYEGSPAKIEPAAGPRYDGPVYVLTSAGTCSAAEDFLVPLKTTKRITIVGEPTCGSTGKPLLFSIYGASAQVCTKWDRFPDGTEFVGIGILPDVKAAKSKNDVAFGRDAVLQTAIGLAQRGQTTN